MATDLQLRARQAVAGIDPSHPSGIKLPAIKVLRDATRGDRYSLADLKAAVEWAIDNPEVRAADLPDGSVVANHRKAWIKNHPALHYPWSTTDGSVGQDHNVDDALANGATVLRVGTGGA